MSNGSLCFVGGQSRLKAGCGQNCPPHKPCQRKLTHYRKMTYNVRSFAGALLILSGCGYVGEPLPPLMNVPGRAENLAAVQRGPNIIAHFTLPTLTTEGRVLKQSLRLDVRIGVKPEGQFNAVKWAASAKAISGGTTVNGVATYTIPAAEWTGKQVVVAVRIVGANGRDAGWPDPATLTVVAPPEQPRDLTAIAVPQGVQLTWHGAGNVFAVLRRGRDEKDYQPLGRSDKPEWTDATAEFGKPYSYVVQSLVKAGDGEAQSELSREAAITPVDTFPPATPTGLTAVPSTTSIELVWERGTEPNLAGYRVYRAVGNGAFERVSDTQELPAYSDHKIEAGKTYRYAVTAVKANGMESKQSEPVEVTAP
jgi:hypothetical protein